jgi:hypothetical protein
VTDHRSRVEATLLEASTAFADRLTSLVADVMPGRQPPFLAEVTPKGTVAAAVLFGHPQLVRAGRGVPGPLHQVRRAAARRVQAEKVTADVNAALALEGIEPVADPFWGCSNAARTATAGCSLLINSGIAERQVRLSEQQGAVAGQAIKRILDAMLDRVLSALDDGEDHVQRSARWAQWVTEVVPPILRSLRDQQPPPPPAIAGRVLP